MKFASTVIVALATAAVGAASKTRGASTTSHEEETMSNSRMLGSSDDNAPKKDECECTGAKNYRLIQDTGRRCRRAAELEAGSMVGQDEEVMDGQEHRELCGQGMTFSEWVDEISNSPEYAGCTLAPIYDDKSVEFYRAIVDQLAGGPGSMVLLGGIRQSQYDAYLCTSAREKEPNPTKTPKECLAGWINIKDGSPINVSNNLWGWSPKAGEPDGDFECESYNGVVRLGISSTSIYDEPFNTEFDYALIECCIEATCYSTPPPVKM